jgi:mannose-6-phosphate isomerase-like protein (cupin superfamily)
LSLTRNQQLRHDMGRHHRITITRLTNPVVAASLPATPKQCEGGCRGLSAALFAAARRHRTVATTLHQTAFRRVSVAAALVGLSVIGIGCRQTVTAKQVELPKESYERQPEQPHSSSDYVFKLNQMISFYDVPGEFGHAMEGIQYGFESLSFIISETQPGGGPPLHVHESEEAHVLLQGKASYVIGNERFTVEAPFVLKVPAGVPHTFVNTGSARFRLIGVFPAGRISYKELGPNPMVNK